MNPINIFLAAALTAAAAGNASALDLSLEQCRSMALASDENIRIAENSLKGAGLDRAVARTAYLPNFAGSATGAYRAPDSEFSGMTLQMRGLYMAGINLTQPVFAGGKIVAANRLARTGEEIAREQLRATRMDVVADAEKSYWMYVAVLAKVDMTESYLALLDSMQSMTASSVELGMATRQSLLRVDSRRSEIVYRLRQARAGADVCRMALCRVIGVDDTVTINPTERPDLDPGMLPEFTGIDARPELQILERNVDVKRHQVAMTRADFLPTIGLQVGWSAFGNLKVKGMAQDASGNWQPYSSTTNSTGFMGLLSVQVPLFHWGEGVKKVRRAKIDVENARLSLERNRRLINLEANQAYSNMTTGLELIASAELAFSEADENLRLMTEQYEVGLVTLTDMLEAQSQWHSSYSNLIEARTQLRIYTIDYLRAVGRL